MEEVLARLKIGLSDEDKLEMREEIGTPLNEHLNEKIAQIDATIKGLGGLKPSGVDTSTNILAFTYNKGIYIANDTGGWYYWKADVSKYVYGGVYQNDINTIDLGVVIYSSPLGSGKEYKVGVVRLIQRIEAYIEENNIGTRNLIFICKMQNDGQNIGIWTSFYNGENKEIYVNIYRDEENLIYHSYIDDDTGNRKNEEVVQKNVEIADGSITPEKTSFIETNAIYENEIITVSGSGAWVNKIIEINNVSPNVIYTLFVGKISGTLGELNIALTCVNASGTNTGEVSYYSSSDRENAKLTIKAPENTTKIKLQFFLTNGTSGSGTATFENVVFIHGQKLNYSISRDINLPEELVNLNESNEEITFTTQKYTNIPYSLDLPNDCLSFAKVNKISGSVTKIISKGENLINLIDKIPTTTSGITYEVKDGVIKLNGQATADISIFIDFSGVELVTKEYTFAPFFSGKASGSMASALRYGYDTTIYNLASVLENIVSVFTPSTNVIANTILLYIVSGTNFNNVEIKPMLVKGNQDLNFRERGKEYKKAFEEILLLSNATLPTYIKTEGNGSITFENKDKANVTGEVIFYYKKNVDRFNAYKNYGLPILYLEGSTDGISKDNKVNLNYVYGERSGTCTLKWQGSSSINYSKKNYTIKFDNPFEAKEGWGEQDKYCLKANFIDFSHARNVVSAKLWGQVVKSRTNVPIQLNSLVNGGAVDGFPCVVVINGKYQGLYTFNIPKDAWLFGMGSGNNECIICGEDWVDATTFRGPAKLDGTDFEIEYITNEDNTQWAVNSFNNIYNALQNVGASNFESVVGQYVDLDSVIDYYIYTSLIQAIDCTGKNYIMVTYDGVKWFMSAYDLDSTYGLYPDGTKYIGLMYGSANFEGWAYLNTLMGCIKNYCKDKVKARYEELRSGVLSEENVALEFLNFTKDIPRELFDEEVKLWRDIPSTSNNNVHQIIDYYNLTCKHRDKQVENL